MAYPIVRIDPTTPGRERSPALWRSALEKYDADRLLGVLRADDFTDPISTSGGAGTLSTDGRWWCAEAGTTGVTSEDFATAAEPDGIAVLTAVANADFKGVRVHAGPTAALVENIVLPTATTDSKSDVIFETCVYLDITTNSTFFAGLGEAAMTILTADNTLTLAGDYIGFYRLDDGNLLFVSRSDKAGGTATSSSIIVKTTAQMLASYNAKYVKLGFRVNADNSVEVYIAGSKVKVTNTGTKVTVPYLNLPIEKLSRQLEVCGGDDGIDPVVIKCDWIDCYVAE